MKKIKVKDKAHIRRLLYAEFVMGIKGDQYRSFGGFQLLHLRFIVFPLGYGAAGPVVGIGVIAQPTDGLLYHGPLSALNMGIVASG